MYLLFSSMFCCCSVESGSAGRPQTFLLMSTIFILWVQGMNRRPKGSFQWVQEMPFRPFFSGNVISSLWKYPSSDSSLIYIQNANLLCKSNWIPNIHTFIFTYSRLRNKRRGTLINLLKILKKKKNQKWSQCLDWYKKVLKSWCENF